MQKSPGAQEGRTMRQNTGGWQIPARCRQIEEKSRQPNGNVCGRASGCRLAAGTGRGDQVKIDDMA